MGACAGIPPPFSPSRPVVSMRGNVTGPNIRIVGIAMCGVRRMAGRSSIDRIQGRDDNGMGAVFSDTCRSEASSCPIVDTKSALRVAPLLALLLCCTAARPVIATTLLVEGRPRAGRPLRRNHQRGGESARAESTVRRSAADAAVGDRRRPAPHVHPQQPGPRDPGAELASRRADQHLAAGGRAGRRRGPHRRRRLA